MLKIGVWLPSDFQDPGDYLADARALEAAEADSLWVGPGLQVDQPESRLGPEVFPLLGAIASVTYRVRLAIWIGSLHALSPDTLSPVIDSLQRLSRGRMLVATAGSAEQQLDERIIKSVKQSLERVAVTPLLCVAGSDREEYPVVSRSADGVICGGELTSIQAVFHEIRQFRDQEKRQDPFELWALVAAPPSLQAWRETRAACEAAGATGLIVPIGPRLLDMLRRGDEPQEDDRSDLLLSYG